MGRKEEILQELEDMKFKEVLEKKIEDHDCKSLIYWCKMAGEDLDIEKYTKALWEFVRHPSKVHYGTHNNYLMRHSEECDKDLRELKKTLEGLLNSIHHTHLWARAHYVLNQLNYALTVQTEEQYRINNEHPRNCFCPSCRWNTGY